MARQILGLTWLQALFRRFLDFPLTMTRTHDTGAQIGELAQDRIILPDQ